MEYIGTASRNCVEFEKAKTWFSVILSSFLNEAASSQVLPNMQSQA